MGESVRLSDISDDVKFVKTSVAALTDDVKQLSSDLFNISKMLESFGETLGPIIKAKVVDQMKNEYTRSNTSDLENIGSKDMNSCETLKQLPTNGKIVSAKSFHRFPTTPSRQDNLTTV